MKIFKLLVSCALTSGFFAMATAYAAHETSGPGGTGGGKGVVCRGKDGTIQSVKLLDLWESEVIYGRTTATSTEPVAAQVAAAIERLKFSVQPGVDITINGKTEPELLVQNLTATAQRFLGNSPTVVRLHGQRLSPTNDSFEPAQPGSCEVEQLVYFMDSPTQPKVLVNQDLYDMMDSTNQAALITHEAFYTYLRNGVFMGFIPYVREVDSIRVRRAVGYVFAGNAFPSLAELLGQEYIDCSSDQAPSGQSSSSIYFYRDKSGQAFQVTTDLFGKPMVGFFPVSAQLPEPDFLERAVKGDLCAKAENGEQSIGQHAGSGPVDFQDNSYLTIACEDHKASFYLSTTPLSYGLSTDSGQRLLCTVRHPETLQ